MSNYAPPDLPLKVDLENKVVLKQVAAAHRRLAELKGLVMTIPNEEILISTLTLQEEARESSEIENIITTQDELFKAELFTDYTVNVSTKEVQNYASALRRGFEAVRKNKILSKKHILQIQKELKENEAGFRKLPGTALKNAATGETIYCSFLFYTSVDISWNIKRSTIVFCKECEIMISGKNGYSLC